MLSTGYVKQEKGARNMNKRFSPKVQSLIGVAIFIIAMGWVILPLNLVLGYTPGTRLIQIIVLGILIVPNAVYFSANVSSPNLRKTVLIITIGLCCFLTSLDGRLRFSIILIIYLIVNVRIYLSKRRLLLSDQSDV
jgi:hypothetical protein